MDIHYINGEITDIILYSNRKVKKSVSTIGSLYYIIFIYFGDTEYI